MNGMGQSNEGAKRQPWVGAIDDKMRDIAEVTMALTETSETLCGALLGKIPTQKEPAQLEGKLTQVPEAFLPRLFDNLEMLRLKLSRIRANLNRLKDELG